MADFSAKHYQIKSEKNAVRAEEAADRAEEVKNIAVEAVAKLNEIDTTVDNAKAEITTVSNEEKAAIQETAEETRETVVKEINQAGESITSYQAPLIALSATSGTVSLVINKVYTISVSGTTTFSLPTPSNTNVFNQIKVMMKVTGTPTINWGTTRFFNKKTPKIEAGNYDVYFDYDNLLGAWVCGAMAKGAAS